MMKKMIEGAIAGALIAGGDCTDASMKQRECERRLMSIYDLLLADISRFL